MRLALGGTALRSDRGGGQAAADVGRAFARLLACRHYPTVAARWHFRSGGHLTGMAACSGAVTPGFGLPVRMTP